ncbi:hypothetical protein QBC46DRAFT_375021 [Diplogelasinospora grovesii]|uniref:Uncharacterized protein n=1 Tax=Diplogelasinospora grovesii TaxID=303347 RepID=A0AAN6NEI2_9PEZI|nr:hypothetical protein QBC46DRAFT_375021 [Diplogelasinospora grovesii]
MDYPEDTEDPVGQALSTRRIPHSRLASGGRRRGKQGQAVFDPVRLLGVYEVTCPALTRNTSTAVSRMEIHGFTNQETALIGTLSLGDGRGIYGMFILAGSRKVLQEAVDDLDNQHQHHDDSSASTDGEEDEEADVEDRREKRSKAFEKNSFRNPKFWMAWKGRVQTGDADGQQQQQQQTSERNQGYLVFASNDCRDFKGTLSYDTLGWENVEVVGRKVTSKARECPLQWADFDG